jgi:carbonic anhydrase/acetyltransferase-like protein (isoleucine patch superfamily)
MEDRAMSLEANTIGDFPEIASTARVHPTATIIGNVYIGDRVFVGPNAVIRADELGIDGHVQPIRIGESANIQDCTVIHAIGGTGVTIGPRTSIAHAAVIHGPCKIGAGCFIGFHSVVFRATLEDGVVVMHQALVESAAVQQGRLIPSMTAVCSDYEAWHLKPVPPETTAFVEKVIAANLLLVEHAPKRPQSRRRSVVANALPPR